MVLAIYNEGNEGAYLSFKSLFYNALGLFEFECNQAWICSWNQPVLSNKDKTYCSRKQCNKVVFLCSFLKLRTSDKMHSTWHYTHTYIKFICVRLLNIL